MYHRLIAACMEVKKMKSMFNLQPQAMMFFGTQSEVQEKPVFICQQKEGTFLSKQTSQFIIQEKMV